MNYIEARYLKYVGAEIDVKVTIVKEDGVTVIYIRDYTFYTFKKAAHYLRFIAETEMVSADNKESIDNNRMSC